MPMGPSKTYLVRTPALAQAIIRARTLSFEPMAAQFGRRLFLWRGRPHIRDQCCEISLTEPYLLKTLGHAIDASLGPGPELIAMNLRVLSIIADCVNDIGPKEILHANLYDWLRDTFTKGFTHALLGSHNPFTGNRYLRDQFWVMEEGALGLMFNPLPWLTARSAWQARETVQDALGSWFRAGHIKDPDVSLLTRNRYKILYGQYGMDALELGDAEASMLLVGTTNAVPTIFWLIAEIFSAPPSLISSLQDEILKVTTRSADGKTATIDISRFSTETPLLVACYQETHRIANRQIGIRWVQSDTEIRDENGRTYLLTEGSIVQLITAHLHHDPAVWGDDAGEFNPHRWLSASPATVGLKSKDQKNSFVPFGGGKHLCPGRHFAWAEILGLAAVLVLGYEMEELGSKGKVKVPRESSWGLTEGVPKPNGRARDYDVGVRRRAGWEGVRWEFVHGEDEKPNGI